MTDKTPEALAPVLRAALQSGIAHNNGAGGQYLLCATEQQLLAFAAALAAQPPQPAAQVPPSSLGVPASPSGSSLQPPSAASAAIPNAGATHSLIAAAKSLAGYAAWCCEPLHYHGYAGKAQALDARIKEVATAVSAIEKAIDGAPLSSYSIDDQAFYRFWYGHMLDDLMQPPLVGLSHAAARYIWDAARGIEREARVSEGPRPKAEEPGAACGTRPETMAAPVPEGWKLVPVKPTPAMWAAWDRAPGDEDGGVERNIAWAAMLSAAPSSPPPAAEVAGQSEREVLEIMSEGGWRLTCNTPWEALTDEANDESKWVVQRTERPFCGSDGVRQWSGPTALEAIYKARAALTKKGEA